MDLIAMIGRPVFRDFVARQREAVGLQDRFEPLAPLAPTTTIATQESQVPVAAT